MIICSDCGKELRCKRQSVKPANSSICPILNTKRCVCPDCYVKRHYSSHNLLFYAEVGCWSEYSKEYLEKLMVAYEL